MIDRFDPFNNSYTLAWDLDAGTVSNGELTIVGDGNWNGLWLNTQFTEGQGIIMRYKTEGGREWDMSFDNGASWGPELRSLGVVDYGYPGVSVFKGTDITAADDLKGNLQPKLGTWYQMMIVIGDDARFLVVISDITDPTQVILYEETFGEDWADLSWNFSIGVNQGTLTIDDFMKVSFSDIK